MADDGGSGEAGMSGSEALELLKDELYALDPRALPARVFVDLPMAAVTVRAMVRDFQPYRAALVAELGEERVRASIDRLELLALAAASAHAKYRATMGGVDLEPAVSETREMREVLLAEVRALMARKLVEPGALSGLSGGSGHLALVGDVLLLVAVFEVNAEAIGTATGLDRAYRERAEAVASRLSLLLAQREQGSRTAAAELRLRAFGLLWQTYDDARRYVTFLRWRERDYDRIAPSLAASRGSRRRREEEVEPEERPEDGEPPPGSDPGAEGL